MMLVFKKKVVAVLMFLFIIAAICSVMFGYYLMPKAEEDPITTTFSVDMGAWASDPGSTASTEIAFDDIEGGYLKMSLTGGSPSLVMDGISIDTAQYTAMAFRVKYDLQNPSQMAHPSMGNRFSVYYGSDTVGYGSALFWPSVTIDKGVWQTIIVDFTDASLKHPDYPGTTWNGVVSKFRLDPIWSEKQYYEPGDVISIDFIKFYADKASAEAEIGAGFEDDALVNASGSENYFNFTKGNQNWEQSQNNADGSGWSEAGELKVVLGNNDPQISYNWKIGVSLDRYKYLAFKMKNGTTGEQAKIYFGTKNSPGYDETKTGTVALEPSSDYAVYVFDMSENANWKGVLTSLRFDVVDDSANKPTSGEVLLDWIGFYETRDLIPAADWEDDDMTLPEGPVEEFAFTDSTEGWVGNADVTVSNAYSALQLMTEQEKNDPNITYVYENGLKTSTYTVMQVKIRNKTAGTKFTVYFAGKDAQIDGTNFADFTISANDSAYQIYTFNLASASGWTNEDVYTLRIDPSDVGDGEILIDYIRFYRSMSEAETNGEYEDDSVLRPNAHSEFNFNLYNSYWRNSSSDNADVACKDGSMVVTLKGAAPVVEYEWEHGDYSDWAEGIDAKTWNYVVMKVRVTSERETVAGKLQFRRNLVGEKYVPDMAFDFTVATGEWEIIEIDLQANHFWNSTIAALRLYPIVDGVSGEVFEIDYLKFYKTHDDIIVDGDYEDDPTGEAKNYFDFREEENRFDEARSSHGTVSITEDGMVTDITGQDPVLMYSYVYDGVGLDADKYQFMKISLKNESTATMYEVFWDSMDDEGNVTTWGTTTNFTIETMSANDTEFKEYIIDFSAKEGWEGTILRLRYDPAGWLNETDVSGKVTTRYIKFYETAEEAAADQPWDDGSGSETPENPDGSDGTEDPDGSEKPGDLVNEYTEWKKNPMAIAGLIIGCIGLASAVALCVVFFLKK